MLHSLFVESGKVDTMLKVLHNSISTTTDMGTEFGAADFRVQCCKDLLPEWLREIRNVKAVNTADVR